MQVRSCETLVILITSFGEFLLYFIVIFYFHFIKKKKTVLQDCFRVPYLCCRRTSYSGLKILKATVHLRLSGKIDCDKMEPPHEEQYSPESNPRAYMTMRDYRNLAWQNQQPWERNPNPPRSMRDYRDQWMSSPYGSTYNHSWGNHTNSSWEPKPPQYAPPEPLYYASIPQPQQPPQLISPVEQAILDFTRIVDDFVEENKEINVHSIVTVEDNLNKKIDGLKDDFEHEWDNLQDSIKDLIDQQQCPPEEECQSGTMVEESCLQKPQEILVENFEPSVGAAICLWEEKEATFPLTEKSSGHETVEGTQEPIIQPNPIDLDPNATAQPKATHC